MSGWRTARRLVNLFCLDTSEAISSARQGESMMPCASWPRHDSRQSQWADQEEIQSERLFRVQA